jgi:hypothetical protein
MSLIDVQVERPVTIKADGKKIKLTDEEARELARKLNDVLGIEASPGHPWYPWYPWYPTTWTEGGTTSPEVHITGGDLSGLSGCDGVIGSYTSFEVV